MAEPVARSAAQRKADALAKLRAPATDGWVATAGSDDDGPHGHLVPLSLAWIDERVVVAVEASSVTGRNLAATGAARIGLGLTRDVVLVDAVLVGSHPADAAPDAIGEGYAAQADWDPREAGPGYVFLVLEPRRIQVWTEVHELAGRTVMRDGRWLV